MPNFEQIIAIIPARYGSQRFEGKPLADIAGKSMIVRVFEQVKKCTLLHSVWVATDDERIFAHCQQNNVAVLMTHSEHQSGTDRCAEAWQILKKQQKFPANFLKNTLIVNVQGDEPLMQPQQIEELIAVFENPNAKIASLVRDIEPTHAIENVNTVKVVKTLKGKVLYFSRSIIPYFTQKQAQQRIFQHVGMYAFRAKTLQELVQLPVSNLEATEKLEQLRWLENDFEVYVNLTKYDTHAVDTPQDLEKVVQLLATT